MKKANKKARFTWSKRNNYRVWRKAFPDYLQDDLAVLTDMMPKAKLAPNEGFAFVVSGEIVEAPIRIYNDEPSDFDVSELSAQQRSMIHCMYSRHHDGHVRERHLKALAASRAPWALPFVARAASEYVEEIARVIDDATREIGESGSEMQLAYAAFARQNSAYVAASADRARNYWHEYYRHRYPDFTDYPGVRFFARIKAAAQAVPPPL